MVLPYNSVDILSTINVHTTTSQLTMQLSCPGCWKESTVNRILCTYKGVLVNVKRDNM